MIIFNGVRRWVVQPKQLVILFCAIWLSMPLQAATVAEVEVNNIFPDLSDANNSPDFSQAMVPSVGDTYIGALGHFPITSLEDLQPNDLDFWTFDLHEDIPFNVFFDDSDPPRSVGGFNAMALLYMEDGGQLSPVAGNISGAIRSKSVGFTPWKSGRYYFGFGDANNYPKNVIGNNISNAAFFTTEFLNGAVLDSFNGLGNAAIYYEMQFLTGVFAPTPVASAVPVPAALWLFVSGLFSFGWLSRRRAI